MLETTLSITLFQTPVSSRHMIYIYFCYCFLGFGLGLGYLPAIVSVSYYFEKRRSLATGLAVCGSGLGTFIFAPLTELLLHEYGWKGTVLIESGILLNCCICGAVLRPLRAPRRRKTGHANESSPILVQDQGVVSLTSIDSPSYRSSNGRKIRTISEGADRVTFDKNGSEEGGNLDQAVMIMSRSESFINHAGKEDHDAHARAADILSPMARKDIFYTASLDHIPLYKVIYTDIFITSVLFGM